MDKIRFLHIPKTAGFSFTECLSWLYPGPQFYFRGYLPTDRERYHGLSDKARRNVQLVIGHAPRLTKLANIDELPTITFLRDPIARAKSFCQHVSEGKSPHLREQFPPHQFDLDKFLDSGNGELFNLQTRTLLGSGSYHLPKDHTSAVVDDALHILDKSLQGFGLVEEFETSLLMFHHTFRWKRWPLYRTLNKQHTTQRLIFRDAHIEKIKLLNQYDTALYDGARQLFYQRVGEAKYLDEARTQFKAHQRYAFAFLGARSLSRKLQKRLFKDIQLT